MVSEHLVIYRYIHVPYLVLTFVSCEETRQLHGTSVLDWRPTGLFARSSAVNGAWLLAQRAIS